MEGDASIAGDVLERMRGEALGVMAAAGFLSFRCDGVGGKRVKMGDFAGWGDVLARRTRFMAFSLSSCSMASLMVLRRSSVAWRRARSVEAGCGFSTLPNITL